MQDPPNLPVYNDVASIIEFIDLGAITPEFFADDLIAAGVNPACLGDDPPADPLFGAVFLDATGTEEQQLVIIEFIDDETTRIFEAEDCSVLG